MNFLKFSIFKWRESKTLIPAQIESERTGWPYERRSRTFLKEQSHWSLTLKNEFFKVEWHRVSIGQVYLFQQLGEKALAYVRDTNSTYSLNWLQHKIMPAWLGNTCPPQLPRKMISLSTQFSFKSFLSHSPLVTFQWIPYLVAYQLQFKSKPKPCSKQKTSKLLQTP